MRISADRLPERVGGRDMYCGFCGKSIRDDAVFCSFCGRQVKPYSAAEAPAKQPAAADPASEPTAIPPVAQSTAGADAPKPLITTDVPVPSAAAPAKGPTGRSRQVYDFVSVPEEWEQPAESVRPRPAAAPIKAAEPPVRESVREKATQYGGIIKEKATQYGAAAKEKAAEAGAAAKEKAVRYGDLAKQQAAKLGSATKEKATEGMERLQAAPMKRIEKRTSDIIGTASKLSLLLILIAVFVPYCRMEYSDARMANMPLWKLIFGGMYTMGDSNPLQFTLRAHPELLLLLLLPLAVLLPLFFRRVGRRFAVTAGILTVDGLVVVLWNGAVLRSIQNAISGMTLETFEKHVVSMNSVVIKWVQQVIDNRLSFAGTFQVNGRFGFALFAIFGWLMLLMGTAGFIVILLRMLKKKQAVMKRTKPAFLKDDELTEDML